MRHLSRLTASITGLTLAVTVALPALAATVAPAPPVAGSLAAPAAPGTGAAQCAAAWVTVRADRSVQNTQAVGDCEIDRRLSTIDRLRGIVGEAGALTPAHATALTAILDRSASGLTALRSTLAADTTLPDATADVRRIFTDYRVYVLVDRQVVLVHADDRADAAADRLTQAADQLGQAIEQAKANGKDVTAAQGHLDAMTAAITAGRGQVAGDADAMLALTPQGWNAGSAKPVLDAGRASISAARTDFRTALSEARAVLEALR